MATRPPRRPAPRRGRRAPSSRPVETAEAYARDVAARRAALPEPYQSAARLLPDHWRFIELAWLYELAHNGQDTLAAELWFPEMKQRHDELFAELLPRRRGRPETYPTRRHLTVLAPHLRQLYEDHLQAFARDRALRRLRGGATPAEQALAWVATHFNIPQGKLRRTLHSPATNAAYRARLKDEADHLARLAAVPRPSSPPRP